MVKYNSRKERVFNKYMAGFDETCGYYCNKAYNNITRPKNNLGGDDDKENNEKGADDNRM
jgi:hypothetical protein